AASASGAGASRRSPTGRNGTVRRRARAPALRRGRAAAGARSRSPAGATARKAPWRPSAAAPRRASRSRRGRRQQRLQGGADAFGDRRAAAAVAVDEDVHEPAFGRRLVLAGAEQADAVADAAVAKLLHAQAGVDAAGE